MTTCNIRIWKIQYHKKHAHSVHAYYVYMYTAELMTMTITTTELETNNWLTVNSNDITILCRNANNYGNVQSRMYKTTQK